MLVGTSLRAALVRLSLLLGIVLVGAAVWEHSRLADHRAVTGSVTEVEQQFAGPFSDSRRFKIRYQLNGSSRETVETRGYLDRLGPLRSLGSGDDVELAVDPAAPSNARLNTVNARYPASLTIATLAALLYITVGAMKLIGRLPGERRG